MSSCRIICSDVMDGLRSMDDGSVRCAVTSPPYWGLRDYGNDGQIGLESTPEEYVAKMVDVFREVRRVLADDGTLWLNLGDSYAGRGRTGGMNSLQTDASAVGESGWVAPPAGLKQKDLVGIPWRVAFALQSDGWWLRSDIIWSKPNPMPESVTDRPTKSHEYMFLLAKSRRYYFDQDAVRISYAREWDAETNGGSWAHTDNQPDGTKAGHHSGDYPKPEHGGANIRTVWEIPTHPYPDAHFATFPPALVEPCIKAGSAEGDTVLDPFCGAGTTGMVALRLNRRFVGVELNPEYAELAGTRIYNDAPMLNAVEVI